ncbi:transmembrane protein, putative (macronuclear) [Tetrahymena thermophila SB210]|uniref:Transmembrane protein, putative n=1 Tax=Tetrahymena thermophila (strain SB210) TaxID=312017 RepID=W7X5A6_TETTS|nr:transmembrane protein, putative [Tetrahymena thermophila SB210]EWS71543.1 transmembrane protein, putative [Tetrahymena thermophila SB210]|eukprot:XP_012655926.1 transmembrane protein, putative [Tetrahymena thermophila SB210]
MSESSQFCDINLNQTIHTYIKSLNQQDYQQKKCFKFFIHKFIFVETQFQKEEGSNIDIQLNNQDQIFSQINETSLTFSLYSFKSYFSIYFSQVTALLKLGVNPQQITPFQLQLYYSFSKFYTFLLRASQIFFNLALISSNQLPIIQVQLSKNEIVLKLLSFEECQDRKLLQGYVIYEISLSISLIFFKYQFYGSLFLIDSLISYILQFQQCSLNLQKYSSVSLPSQNQIASSKERKYSNILLQRLISAQATTRAFSLQLGQFYNFQYYQFCLQLIFTFFYSLFIF